MAKGFLLIYLFIFILQIKVFTDCNKWKLISNYLKKKKELIDFKVLTGFGGLGPINHCTVIIQEEPSSEDEEFMLLDQLNSGDKKVKPHVLTDDSIEMPDSAGIMMRDVSV